MRVLIVDDEPPARARLRTLLELVPDADGLEVVGEAEDGEAAIEAVLQTRPDVLVLDVQMPGMDGFAVVRALYTDPAIVDALGDATPVLIFATAFDQHAVRAFEVHAVDYLVKPFDAKRLATALSRARERVQARRASGGSAAGSAVSATLPPDVAAVLASLQGLAPASAAFVSRLAVRVGERVYYVRTADIEWVEADGNYLRLHTGTAHPQGRSHLIRKPLSVLADELDPAQFARIHRSTLVNIDRIRELRALSDGEYQVVLLDGTKLKLSRTYRSNLPNF